jgi:hypothetical protein
MYGFLNVSEHSIPVTQAPTTLFCPASLKESIGTIYPILFEIKKPVYGISV